MAIADIITKNKYTLAFSNRSKNRRPANSMTYRSVFCARSTHFMSEWILILYPIEPLSIRLRRNLDAKLILIGLVARAKLGKKKMFTGSLGGVNRNSKILTLLLALS